MAKEFLLRFATARYWVSATEAEKHAQNEFETRNEAKDWLVERGVMFADAENYLLKSTGEPFESF